MQQGHEIFQPQAPCADVPLSGPHCLHGSRGDAPTIAWQQLSWDGADEGCCHNNMIAGFSTWVNGISKLWRGKVVTQTPENSQLTQRQLGAMGLHTHLSMPLKQACRFSGRRDWA